LQQLALNRFTHTCESIINSFQCPSRALEDAGVEFIPAKNGKGVGVRLREDT